MNFRKFLQNPKTTAAGIISIVTGVTAIVASVKDFTNINTEGLGIGIVGILGGLGSLFAQDAAQTIPASQVDAQTQVMVKEDETNKGNL